MGTSFQSIMVIIDGRTGKREIQGRSSKVARYYNCTSNAIANDGQREQSRNYSMGARQHQ